MSTPMARKPLQNRNDLGSKIDVIYKNAFYTNGYYTKPITNMDLIYICVRYNSRCLCIVYACMYLCKCVNLIAAHIVLARHHPLPPQSMSSSSFIKGQHHLLRWPRFCIRLGRGLSGGDHALDRMHALIKNLRARLAAPRSRIHLCAHIYL